MTCIPLELFNWKVRIILSFSHYSGYGQLFIWKVISVILQEIQCQKERWTRIYQLHWWRPNGRRLSRVNFKNYLNLFFSKEIFGYKCNWTKTFLTWILIILSAFILRLIFYWRSHWMLYCTHKRCSQSDADTVLLIVSYYDFKLVYKIINIIDNYRPFKQYIIWIYI